jgi:hypothetical protein
MKKLIASSRNQHALASSLVKAGLSSLVKNRQTVKLDQYNYDNSTDASFTNYSLPQAKDFQSTQTNKMAFIGPNIRVAIGPDRGTIKAKPNNILSLQISDLAEGAGTDWIELAIELQDTAWLSCSQIHLRYCASAKAMTNIRPAIRILYKEGFHDRFAGNGNVIVPTPQSHSAVFDLPPNLMTDAVRVDLHLFFGMVETTLDLHDLGLTGT